MDDGQDRPWPPLVGDETATLLGFLDSHRATLEWKCSGLDTAGLTATVGASSMTLGGLLKHLARVEDRWFSVRLLGNDPAPVWQRPEATAERDWEWRSAAEDTPEQLRTTFRNAVAHSRECVSQVLADGDLDQVARTIRPDGQPFSLRWILIHMIEEYARHNGHADLLRESVDGQVGE